PPAPGQWRALAAASCAACRTRHQEHAPQCRDAEVVPERRGQLHLLIVNEIRHDERSCGPKARLRASSTRNKPPSRRIGGGAIKSILAAVEEPCKGVARGGQRAVSPIWRSKATARESCEEQCCEMQRALLRFHR